jgi:mRNA interferase MazF
VVQTDLFAALPSVILCPLTSELRNDAEQFRIDIDPTPGNGLREPSQIMIDKIGAAPLTRIGKVIGQADEAVMLRVGRSLALMLGLA